MDQASHKVGQVAVISLAGRFDAHVVPGVQKWLEGVTASPPAQVVVNLTDVTFMDSAALATLVQGMKRSRQAGGDLRLSNLRQPVRVIFELTRFDRAFDIFDTEDEAVASFAAAS
jgi:anti-sigma B factor antagonist